VRLGPLDYNVSGFGALWEGDVLRKKYLLHFTDRQDRKEWKGGRRSYVRLIMISVDEVQIIIDMLL
jgi:hypothetical protein